MFFVTLFALTQVLVAQVINEVQSTQYKTLQSADRQYYDWIEIYNPTDKPIDLSGYGLSDSKKNPFKWTFPAETNIEAQGYLIVYASGLDKVTGNEIHSNFRLASDGETLRLFNKDSVEIDKVKIPPLQAEISWQRSTDGATVWAMSHKATPGASNHPSYATTKAEAPTFSHKGGFYTSAEQLKLEITAENEVRYTLDGTEPTEKSALYNKAITLDSTMFIRARTFSENHLPSLVVSHSYFIDTTFTLPVVSIQMDDKDLNSHNHGIYAKGPNGTSEYPGYGSNYWMGWEKPVNFEFFEADSQAISQFLGIKISGRISKYYTQKSFSLYARNSYGNNILNYPFFQNREVDRYKNLVLRAGFTRNTNGWGIYDEFASNLVFDTGLELQAWRPVLLLINGENRGIYRLREKFNEHYLHNHFGYNTDEVNILKNYPGVSKNWGHISHGTDKNYLDLFNFAKNNNLGKSKNYDSLSSLMDVENYAAYNAIVMYYANVDWPHNNIKYWQAENNHPQWRWYLYDLDYAFNPGRLDTDMLHWITKDNDKDKHKNIPILFQSLIKNEAFKNQLIVASCDFMSTYFSYENIMKSLDSISKIIEPKLHLKSQ